ncbi:FAD-binding oxidoreductase [Actinomadura verrucosospora]|uniref:FAD/FMN-containing dehydrogenase n=1 Tax=Actinomadura verrucosospora TaxID=46165 RepID=A0A7D3VSP7_ACTVE|nr:FAD-binding oxidoreductase [Actinomadura verrucosospora]QKG18591.1 FAD/FMN-containing dehydrogenase [Actinomadura verrucosospora]
MTINDVRGVLKGRVLLPGDDGFEQATTAWNLTVRQPVAAVVEAADADDVAALVRYARRAGMTVAAQPTGHGASGDVEGLILLRTGLLNEVEVRAEERVVRVGAGAKWGQVLAAAGPLGLAGLSGSAPGVGVTGYALGGGVGWFSRKYGFASDSVRAIDIVDADGEPGRVTAESDPELFWALRGGGGDFAVVTGLELDLYPVPAIYGGRVVWPGHRTREVYDAFLEVTAEAPRELSVWINRFQPPGAPPMVTLDLAYLGEAAQAQDLLVRLDKIEGAISDSRGAVAVADLGTITVEPTDPTPSISRAELLTGLDADAVELLSAKPLDPLINLQIRHLGGALAEPGDGAGASGAVAEPYLLSMVGLGLPHIADATRAKQAEVVADLKAYVSGRKPYTVLSPGETAAESFSDGVLARLREIKRARDPHNVFRANYPVLG